MMTSSSHYWDVIIIGAGAAGLMAAASASGRGRRVLLLEKNRKLGVKILMSGGTRCNITHDCGANDIAAAFGQQGKFLHSALAALPPDEIIRMIESEGVTTKVESTGKIFPVSNSAVDVRDALVKIGTHAGAKIENEQPVDAIEKTSQPIGSSKSHFLIHTNQAILECESVIVTTGGKSYPGCGTTGDGYSWAQRFGHSLVRPVPALTPITCNQSWANDLKGITIEDAEVSIVESMTAAQGITKKNPALDTRRGSFLFTHFGFSGPAVLNASRVITRRPSVGGLSMLCDFVPGVTKTDLANRFRELADSEGKLLVATALSRILPKRLAGALIRNADISPDLKSAELSKPQLQTLIHQIKQNRLPISGTLGFKKAEVTAGGIDLNEVSSKTLQSKLVPGLFFAGEILDVDGPIGGFNFQAAFSTGWLAGLNA